MYNHDGGTNSGIADAEIIDPDDELIYPSPPFRDAIPGQIITDEETDEKPETSRIKQDRPAALDRPASKGMPSLDEWMHFFGKVLIRTGTNFYIDVAFSGVDEEMLTANEIDRIRLNDEERDRIARPFAELAYKTSFTRKHGRRIIATADAFDAMLQIGMWFSRTNRIARKYRKLTAQMEQQGPAPQQAQARIPDEGVVNDERARSHQANGHRPEVRGVTIINPS